MKKSLLLLCLSVASLVGCNPENNTPAPFEHQQYAYVVNVPTNTEPKNLVAFEISYVDADGSTKTKTVTESWSHIIPAKDKFKMKLTSKMILAPGAEKPTSGKVTYYISEGIAGADNGVIVSGYYASAYSMHIGIDYLMFNSAIDAGDVRVHEYEIKPMY